MASSMEEDNSTNQVAEIHVRMDLYIYVEMHDLLAA